MIFSFKSFPEYFSLTQKTFMPQTEIHSRDFQFFKSFPKYFSLTQKTFMPQTEILIFSFDFSETIFRSNLENRSKSECHFLTF